MGITYTILHDPEDKFSRAFRSISVPESFLINADGEIVHTWKGQFDAMSEDAQAKVINIVGNSEDRGIDRTVDDNSNLNINSKCIKRPKIRLTKSYSLLRSHPMKINLYLLRCLPILVPLQPIKLLLILLHLEQASKFSLTMFLFLLSCYSGCLFFLDSKFVGI